MREARVNRRFSAMLISITVMGVLAAALSIMAYQKGGGAHIIGFKSAGNLFIQVIPLLIFAFIVAGMIQVLIPKELISNSQTLTSRDGKESSRLGPGGRFKTLCQQVAHFSK